MYDLLIKQPKIIDGTGAMGWVGDVAVNDGRYEEPPATFKTPYVSSPPVLDNITQSTNIFTGISSPTKMP